MKTSLFIFFLIISNISEAQKSAVRIAQLKVFTDMETINPPDYGTHFYSGNIPEIDSIFYYFSSKDNWGDLSIQRARVMQVDASNYEIIAEGQTKGFIVLEGRQLILNFYFNPGSMNTLSQIAVFIKDKGGLYSDTLRWTQSNGNVNAVKSKIELINILYPNPLKAGNSLNLVFSERATYSIQLINNDSMSFS